MQNERKIENLVIRVERGTQQIVLDFFSSEKIRIIFDLEFIT